MMSPPGYSRGIAVTPNDSTPLTIRCKALYIGGTGAVSVILTGGQTVTLAAVPTGAILPLAANIVRATGTAATNIVALGD
jgi:hypothetical protein